MRMILIAVLCLVSCFSAVAQEPTSALAEKRVSLTERAIALDGSGTPALEATLKTTALNGAEDSPVTNIRMVVRNSGTVAFAFVSGLVTFYDGSGVRCGEGLFKADALSVDESFETDTPGIRIRCSPSTWRIVANNLLPRVTMNGMSSAGAKLGRTNLNLVISVDGEEHPIQLDKPMVVKLGDTQRTIVLREAP
ncbi:MAG TPA: hypothetical protein VGW76_16045 [Pyrinomonadaceae bacterium]|nr:hypothetical protein [Pyrinomonadaceae bacterium]